MRNSPLIRARSKSVFAGLSRARETEDSLPRLLQRLVTSFPTFLGQALVKTCLKFALICGVFAGSWVSSQAAEWEPLFNGKDLTGWDTFLRPANRNDPNYGLNHDPEKVFTVESLDGESVIHISGKFLGGILTTQVFANYHLKLDFRWGKKTWPPRLNLTPDSGLLYHCAAPSADATYPWPRSIEFNITAHDTGEFWSVDKTIADCEVDPIGNSPEELAAFKGWCERNEDTGPKFKFRKGGHKETFRDGGFMPGGDFEKPAGQWNTLELYAVGDRSVHVVNGKVALILTGLRQIVNGKEVPLTQGRIELQSESAEIFFRNVQIRPIKQIPPELYQ